MEKIRTPQSRPYINKRQTTVAARHAKAGHWMALVRPLLGAGPMHDEVGGGTSLPLHTHRPERRRRHCWRQGAVRPGKEHRATPDRGQCDAPSGL